MSNNFVYYSPTKVYFGKGVENDLPKYIKEFGGSSVLLVYGGKSAIRLGLIDLARRLLSEANIPCVELGGIVPNPRLNEVYKGIELGKEHHVDFILAIGGILNANTDLTLLIYSPATYQTSDVIGTYVYREGIENANYSYSTAVSLFLSIIGFTLTYFANKLSNWLTGFGLW